jgi:hypothetical protein
MELGVPGRLANGLAEKLLRFGASAYVTENHAEQLHCIYLLGDLIKNESA